MVSVRDSLRMWRYLRMTNDIIREMDNKNFAMGILIDLSKAFDTVDHLLLLKKMQHC